MLSGNGTFYPRIVRTRDVGKFAPENMVLEVREELSARSEERLAGLIPRRPAVINMERAGGMRS